MLRNDWPPMRSKTTKRGRDRLKYGSLKANLEVGKRMDINLDILKMMMEP